MLSYTRFLLGSTPQFFPAPYEGGAEPNRTLIAPDKNLIVLSAVISF